MHIIKDFLVHFSGQKNSYPLKKTEKYLTNSSEAGERSVWWMTDIESDLLQNSQICHPSQIEGGHNFSSRLTFYTC